MIFIGTGFLICAYLVEKYDFSIDAAISCFSRIRQPGKNENKLVILLLN
jgi:hypothetical protein